MTPQLQSRGFLPCSPCWARMLALMRHSVEVTESKKFKTAAWPLEVSWLAMAAWEQYQVQVFEFKGFKAAIWRSVGSWTKMLTRRT